MRKLTDRAVEIEVSSLRECWIPELEQKGRQVSEDEAYSICVSRTSNEFAVWRQRRRRRVNEAGDVWDAQVCKTRML